jgi:hypothetical protein
MQRELGQGEEPTSSDGWQGWSSNEKSRPKAASQFKKT